MLKKIVILKLSLLMAITTYCQSKATIKIHTYENGQLLKTEEREIVVPEGTELSQMLDKTGIWEEFSTLEDNKQYSIQIEQDWNRRFSEHNKSKRAQLGVVVKRSVHLDGAEVTQVVENSAAYEAGIKIGDVITKIDDLVINDERDVVDYIKTKIPGDEVSIRVNRSGKKKSFKVKLKENPDNNLSWIPFGSGMPLISTPDYSIEADSIFIFNPKNNLFNDSIQISQPFNWNQEGFEIAELPYLGITPGPEPEAQASVGTVEPESSASKIGLEEGDVILELNGMPISNFEDLRIKIRALMPGQDITLLIVRNGKNKTLEGKIGSKSSSSKEDFRIFHDFKGMDELGNLNYDFELDMDFQDIENQLNELLNQLEDQQLMLEEKKGEIKDQLKNLQPKKNFKLDIEISIDDLSQEDLTLLNQKTDTKIDLSNELNFDRISFFPNPSEGIINLSFIPKTQGDVTVILFDSSGEKIYYEMIAGSFGEYNNQIDISSRSAGNYFLQISQNGMSYCKKIIKSN